MVQNSSSEQLLADAALALRMADPAAYLVRRRILRRIITQDRELTGIGWAVPHRKSYVISRERLLQFVLAEELGTEPSAALPELVVLIAQPDRDELAGTTRETLLAQIWRMLFHVHAHLELDRLLSTRRLTPAAIRDRIHKIGQAEFDEIHSVLKHEHFLFSPAGYQEVYVEFAAVYLELRHFAPHWLPTYFPSLHDYPRIDAILEQDLDAAAIFERTRLGGAAEPDVDRNPSSGQPDSVPAPLSPDPASGSPAEPRDAPPRSKRSLRVFEALRRNAKMAAIKGNSVRAAILRLLAARYAAPESSTETIQAAFQELENLVRRLQAALGFDDGEFAAWRQALGGLLEKSTRGFWNADRRLLYDLQKVCVDHEREIYVIDLLSWLWSGGRRPIKRALPNQREVLMSKHLRSATSRLKRASFSGNEREQLSILLRAAARSAEEQLRVRLRPLIGQVMDDVELRPTNLPERVSLKKLIEELLDNVVHSGFLTMGNVRDAISRNNLKLRNLASLDEFVRGDQLLQADRQLAGVLDGVYRRGEFYVRWLQRVSSLAFGTAIGRFLTQYVVIPFGGAYVALEGLEHLVHAVSDAVLAEPLHVLSPESQVERWLVIAGLGSVLMGVINVPAFRELLRRLATSFYRVFHGLLIDMPTWIVRVAQLQELLHTWPVMFVRRYLIYPLIPTLLVWFILPHLKIPFLHSPVILEPLETTVVFLIFNMLLNSRLGHVMEEVAAESIERTWRHIRIHIFVALFELVMDSFKRILESIERLLYAVDEWLRFKSGETYFTFVLKAILGVIWALVTIVIRFCVTLLIEPQINPIKHFPVVTVSHKILLPLSFPFARLLAKPLGRGLANTVAGTTALLLPGVFGFLVWELKENWRLYAANRPQKLLPVAVGHHGETLIRLMKPGIYSGALPKLFGKLRRAERKIDPQRRERAKIKYQEQLYEIEDSLRHFLERDFAMLLAETRAWTGLPIQVREIEIASNSLRIEFGCWELSPQSLWLAFEEQSGWLVASITSPGWLQRVTDDQRESFRAALAGFYQLGGVDLIREQLEAGFEPRTPPYDITERGLVVWPGQHYEVEILYDLFERRTIAPRPRAVARKYELPTFDARRLIFSRSPLTWHQWVEIWEAEQRGAPLAELLPAEVRLLPIEQRLPLVEHSL